MGKLLVIVLCYSALAVSHAHQDDLHGGKSRPGHIEEVKDNYVKQLFLQLFGRKLAPNSRRLSLRQERSTGGLSRLENPKSGAHGPPMEAMMLHRELQSRLGWGSSDNSNKNRGPPPNQQYGPPPNRQNGPPPPPPNQQYGPPPPNQQYGPPPPNQQYGPPLTPPNQQYGPPPNQQYGPPPPPPNQQYGPPPPPPNQQHGPPPPPPNQQYGPPPPPPNQQYGPPPPPPNQQYGPPPPPPNQQYGPPPPNQQYGPPAQSQQYGPPPPNQQYGPPAQSQQYGPPAQSQQYGPPAQSQQYGPPSTNSIIDSGKNNLRVNQGTFGGHIENFKLSEAVKSNDINEYSAPPSQSQYGPPDSYTPSLGGTGGGWGSGDSGHNSNNDQGQPNQQYGAPEDSSGKIYKHVYIHTPPADTTAPEKPRIIKPNKKQDMHYQIMFVKAPSPPQQPPTEIELPAPPQRKTLVYVLVKKPEKPAPIKFTQPKPSSPSKPEVYFIRYKGKNGERNSASDQQNGYDIQSNNRDVGVSTTFNSNDNGGYSSEYDSQPEIISTNSVNAPLASLTNNLVRDSVGYPDREYRAPPSMLSPNQEPMSIAVYDRVRNSVTPSPRTASRRGSLDTASSNVISRVVRRQQGSHYTAPGSKPFKRSSGKMIQGEYVGMASDILNSQHYSENRRSSYEYDDDYLDA